MSQTPKPTDVFVPGKFPIETDNVYANRGVKQQRFTEALDAGHIPLVYGGYGVGKSSLALFCTKLWRQSGREVYIASVFQKSLINIFETILEKFGYSVEVERTSNDEREGSGELGFDFGGGILGFLKAKIAGKIARKQKKALGTRREILIRNPTDSKIVQLCEEKAIVLIIDEMHRAGQDLIRELSAFLKMYSNSQCKKFKIVILGSEHDPRKLVQSDPGIDRNLIEIDLGTITTDEAKNIIIPGFSKLQISISMDLINKICRSSAGAPFIVQFVCLEMANLAVVSGCNQVTEKMYDIAMKKYAEGKAKRQLGIYQRAIETTGQVRYRKQILHAMALIEDEYVTMESLRNKVSELVGQDIPSTALSGPLRALKSKDFGAILCDVDSLSGDGRAYNFTCFSDPAMKSTVRLVTEGILSN